MKKRTVKLGDVCEINPSPPRVLGLDTMCTFVPMEAVDDWSGRILSPSQRLVRDVSKGYTSFSENDVLFAKITPCMENGKCAIARDLCGGIGFGTTEFHVLRASECVLPEWLFYYWRFPETRRRAERSMTGSAGQKRVPASYLETLAIPLPSLPDQRRIAAMLEQADQLRRTRRYALELSDSFLPATFLKMFGEPVDNPNRYPISTLEDELSAIESGFSPVCEGPRTSVDQWAVLGLGAVSTGVFKPEENKVLPLNIPPRPDIEVRNEDVLVTRKNTYDLVAACALVRDPPPRLLLPDTIFRFAIRNRDRLVPAYLWALLTSALFRKRVQSLAGGSAGSMPNISKEKFMSVKLPIPPLTLQQRFADLVREHERLRATQRESLRQAEHLFQTLLHRAFEEN
jgi:type I restriction enzyme S subunit